MLITTSHNLPLLKSSPAHQPRWGPRPSRHRWNREP